jgi:two-component system, LytTR family, response regulator LytT
MAENNPIVKIAIVEDSKIEREKLETYLETFSSEVKIEFKNSYYENAKIFLSTFASQFDLILMDIAMPEINGMEAATRVRKTDGTVSIIFVTNLAQFAVKGYEVNAFDFIVKPIGNSDFRFKMARFLSSFQAKEETKIIVDVKGKKIALATTDIRYVEVMSHTTTYHTINGDYEVYGSMKTAEETLPSSSFVKCNNCYLVNLRYVDGVEGYTAILNEDRLIISHPRKKDFITALNRYFGKGL